MKHILLILIFVFLTESISAQVDIISKPEYKYLIEESRVFPDTLTTKIDYYDATDKLIFTEKFNRNGLTMTTINQFENSQIIKTIEYSDSKILNEANFEYYPFGSIMTLYVDNEIDVIRKINYLDSLYEKILTDSLFEVSDRDTSLTWVLETKYDDLHRKISWYNLEDSIQFDGYKYEYITQSDSLDITITKEFEDGIFISQLKSSDNKTKREITKDYLIIKTRATTKTIEYYDENNFVFLINQYGSIKYFCDLSDTGNHSQDAPISENPTFIYKRKKE